jgi:membrane-bound lytic murein transglycosylase B
MKNYLPLLLLLLLASPAVRAENYAEREDVQAFVAEMEARHGFSRATLTTLFSQTKPVASVLVAIRPPRDPGIRSWQSYRSRFVEPRRIAAGRRFMRQHASELAAAEAQFGVPAEIIASIIGIETIYGKHMGRYTAFSALVTLAFDYPPRAELFRHELEELLLLAREENHDPLSYTGSYAGALGLPQFLPSSVRRYALDFDHDGRIDLRASPADAIGSVAHFLAEHGWQKGEPIATAVIASGEGMQQLIDEGIAPRLTPADMETRGVSLKKVGTPRALPSGRAGDTPIAAQPAALIDFVTPDAPTEYRLGYHNFWVITRYNRSSFYAAAVMDLAAALRASN